MKNDKPKPALKSGQAITARGIKLSECGIHGTARSDQVHRGRFLRMAAIMEMADGQRFYVDETSIELIGK